MIQSFLQAMFLRNENPTERVFYSQDISNLVKVGNSLVSELLRQESEPTSKRLNVQCSRIHTTSPCQI